MRPLFISLEGGDGAGKSTLQKKLERALTAQGAQVLSVREPGGTVLGDRIREWLLHKDPQMKISLLSELLLFLAARAQNLEEQIRPALQARKFVLCDRFNDSTIAYQGAARGLGTDTVAHFCKLTCQGIEPDLTFLLDLDPKEGLRRSQRSAKGRSNGLDRIESEDLEFHQRVRQGLLEQAREHPDRIYRIDATRPPDQVFEEAWRRVLACL